MDISTELLQLLLPKILVDYFTFTTHKKEGETLHLYFEELKDTPKEYVDLKLHSKGFYQEITVQDFPLRGLPVYLHIKRRKWIDLSSNKVVERNWKLVAKGTRLTEEFSFFFKALNRY